MPSTPPTAFVLCGALGREVIAIAKQHGWPVTPFGVDVQHHMQPGRIAPAVEARLREVIPRFERAVVVYGDCGTGGALDEVLGRYNVPRIEGPHCYEMYGGAQFDAMMTEEPGTFFLTDFLVRAYHGTIERGLGLDRYPELRDVYFANYTRLVYLAQRPDDSLLDRAHTIAVSLQLPLEVRTTGYNMLEARLETLMAHIHEERYQPVLPVRAKEDHDGNLSNPLLARHTAAGARPRRRRRGSAPLHGRFQEAADQAAMSAGLIGSDDYSNVLRWSDPQDRDGTARDVAAAIAAELEAQYPTVDWRATAQALRAKQAEHTEQTP